MPAAPHLPVLRRLLDWAAALCAAAGFQPAREGDLHLLAMPSLRSLARYRKDAHSLLARGEASSMPAARRLLTRWIKPLGKAIEQEQEKVRGPERGLWCGAAGVV